MAAASPLLALLAPLLLLLAAPRVEAGYIQAAIEQADNYGRNNYLAAYVPLISADGATALLKRCPRELLERAAAAAHYAHLLAFRLRRPPRQATPAAGLDPRGRQGLHHG